MVPFMSIAGTSSRFLFWLYSKLCSAGLLLLLALAASETQAQIPGDLDPAFGNGGAVAALNISTGNEAARAVVVQPDGKIVVAGYCAVGVSHFSFCAARLHANGLPDLEFGTNGKFTTEFGRVGSAGYAMALQPDGKIVVAAGCRVVANGREFFCVLRLHANGTLDSEFDGPTGIGAFVLSAFPGDSTATAIALQPDRKIVLVGFCADDQGRNRSCAARLNPDGTLDAGFGGGSNIYARSGQFDEPSAVALNIEGKIMIAGTYLSFDGSKYFFVLRITANGAVDTEFNSGAARLVAFNNAVVERLSAVAIQPDNRIVLAGNCRSGDDMNFCIARINSNGWNDDGFVGPSGGINGSFVLPLGYNDDALSAVALQPDGKIVLGGSCGGAFCLTRLHADGLWDTSFDGSAGNGNGLVRVRIGAFRASAHAMALQRDGKIVLAGGCRDSNGNDDFCLARLHGGPFGARNCSPDIVVSATIDTLILARVVRGLSETNALRGMTFAPHALRTSWSSIRNYLITQCGMSLR
jgi:uncharacterized delta-60 repeat protein